MTVIFDDVDVTIEMAFGDAPLETSPTWTDVTTYVRAINVNRGRSSEFSTYGPGTCTLTIDNRDRRFDPEHTTGPFYGDLLPMVPIRVTTSYGGTDYTLFYGFVQGWPTAYNQSNSDAVSTITAIDGTRLLANAVLTEYAMLKEMASSAPYRYWPLQSTRVIDGRVVGSEYLNRGDLVGDVGRKVEPTIELEFPAGAGVYVGGQPGDYEPTDSPSIVAGSFWFNGNVRDAGNNQSTMIFAESGQVYILIDVDWNDSLQVWRIARLAYESTYESLYGSDFATVTNLTTLNGPNNLVWTLEGNDLVIYLNAVEVRRLTLSTSGSVTPASGGLEIAFGLSNRPNVFSHVAIYTTRLASATITAIYNSALAYGDELSSARLARALDEIGWPSAWRDIETGVQNVGVYYPKSSTANDYVQQVENAEQGELFVSRDGEVVLKSRTTADAVNVVALFDDDDTDYPFSNVQVDANTVDAIRNSVAVRYATDTVTVEDSGSVAAYGRAQQSLNAQLIDDPAAASAIGEARLAQTKDPRTRVRRLDVNVRADTSMVPTVAQLELADDVTVSFTPTGVGDELWRAVRVQGVSHTITLERWDTQLYLAPGPIGTNGPLMLLNDDEYGKLSSGNKLG